MAVVAAFFAHGLLFASWTAHIPRVKAHLGIDDGTLGVALLGAPAGSVAAMVAGAWLIPRLGSRRMVRICLAGYCVSGPLVGLAGSVPELFGALFVWGAFLGNLDVAMNTQAISVERVRGRPLMNGMHAMWSVGAFTGAGCGTLGVAVGLSLTTQLVILGVVALLVAGWLSRSLIGDVRNASDAPTPVATAAAVPAPAGARRTTPRRISPAMLLLGAVAFAAMLSEGAAADWSSVYLHESLRTTAAVAGLGYTVFALAMVAVRLFGDRLLERYPAHQLLPALAVLATVAFAVALAVGTVPLTLVGLFLLGIGLGVVIPTAFSAAGRLPGLHPGVGVAAVSGLGWAGFVCGPPLIGRLAGATSLTLALVLVPVLTAFIAVGTRSVRALHAPPVAS